VRRIFPYFIAANPAKAGGEPEFFSTEKIGERSCQH
jgi:hypothetical protein